MTSRKVLVLDRDGTLIIEKNYLSDPNLVELIPGVADALRLLTELGWIFVVVTNQSGVARGMFTLHEVATVNAKIDTLLASMGVTLAGWYVSPDGPVGESSTRKPAPGLVLNAAKDHGFNPAEAVYVGDKASDLLLGRNLGGRDVLVRTGYGTKTESELTFQPWAIIDSLANLPNLLETDSSLPVT